MRARAARRRHLQQRQTVIFGTLVAVLLVAALLGGAMWSGVIPSPVNVPINSGEAGAEPEPVVPPCPPEDTLPVPYSEISANVYNGTDRQGLASQTAASLQNLGIATGDGENGPSYGGVVRLTTGVAGVAAAYTIAPLFSASQIVVDAREDDSVDVLLGAEYESLVTGGESTLDPEEPIPAPENCQPATVADEGGEDA